MYFFLIFMKKHTEINTLENSQPPSVNAWAEWRRGGILEQTCILIKLSDQQNIPALFIFILILLDWRKMFSTDS